MARKRGVEVSRLIGENTGSYETFDVESGPPFVPRDFMSPKTHREEVEEALRELVDAIIARDPDLEKKIERLASLLTPGPEDMPT